MTSTATSSVVITTRDRKDELRTALRSALKQTVAPEVLVADDGSTDGTTEMIQREFPQVRLVRYDTSAGYIARRNECAFLARGEIIFSLDDDAEFVSSRTVEETIREFDAPRVGAVAIPYVEPLKSDRIFQRAPNATGIWVTDSYVGTAHAVRRDTFLQLGGYDEQLVHQGEEKDFCIRLLGAGRVVRLGGAGLIHHYESPKRDMRRMDYYGRRNDILFAWRWVPFPYLPLHLAATTVYGLRSAIASGRPWNMIRGIVSGYLDSLALGERKPVPASIYVLHRKLKKTGPLRIEEIAADLPAVPRCPSLVDVAEARSC